MSGYNVSPRSAAMRASLRFSFASRRLPVCDDVFQGVAIPVEPIGCTVKK
jgi:hypothetical protein